MVAVEPVERQSIEGFGAVFIAQRHRLMAFIQGMVRNPSVAEDIFQEVWIRFAEASERGVLIENQTAWCRVVARNLIFHYWRDRKGEVLVGDSEFLSLVESAFDETESGLEEAEVRRESLANCLRLLPEKSRELLRLKYYVGLSAKAIGLSFQQSPESVLMCLCRVRRAMAKCIEGRIRGAANL